MRHTPFYVIPWARLFKAPFLVIHFSDYISYILRVFPQKHIMFKSILTNSGQSKKLWDILLFISYYGLGSLRLHTLPPLHIIGFPDHVICNVAIYADDITLYSKFDQVFDLWQLLKLTFWTWIWPTRHCGLGQEKSFWFQYKKTGLVLFDRSSDCGAIYVKMNGSVLDEKLFWNAGTVFLF